MAHELRQKMTKMRWVLKILLLPSQAETFGAALASVTVVLLRVASRVSDLLFAARPFAACSIAAPASPAPKMSSAAAMPSSVTDD